MRHRLLALRLRRRSLILPLLAWLAAGSHAAAQSNPFNSDGFPAARGTYGSFPYEQVDPLSGNLIISVTDLSLPGPIPLSVSRSYNSKFHKDFEHGDQSVGEWSPLGVGWRMHFGRVLHAEATTPGTTVIEGTDGGGGALYQTSAAPEGWGTKGFVLYNRTNHTAKFPNGLVYTFGHVGSANIAGPLGIVRYVTEIRDQFNNTVTFYYEGIPGLVTRARQVLNASQLRDVYFVYNSNGTLTNIQYRRSGLDLSARPRARNARPYRAAQGASARRAAVGARVRRPRRARTHVAHRPGGGRVDYTYATVQRRAGSLNQNSRVVSARAVGGRAVTPGTWTFSYNQGANLDTTVVACPCGTTSYRYNGIGISSNFSAWASGTLAERQVRHPVTGAVLEQETFTYQASVVLSPDSIPGEGGQWSDPDVYNALTVQRVLHRPGGGTWTTNYEYNTSYYNDFGRPFRVTELGDLTRITEVAFQYRLHAVDHRRDLEHVRPAPAGGPCADQHDDLRAGDRVRHGVDQPRRSNGVHAERERDRSERHERERPHDAVPLQLGRPDGESEPHPLDGTRHQPGWHRRQHPGWERPEPGEQSAHDLSVRRGRPPSLRAAAQRELHPLHV